MKKILLFVFACTFLVGCGEGGGTTIRTVDPGKKMGSILKRSVDNSGKDDSVPFTGFCTTKIDKALEEQINATGVEVIKVVDNYFVAKGNKDQVYKVASLTFVERLEGTKFDTYKK